MEQKINIAELLKDCPKGMELDCVMFNGVYFDHVDNLRLNSIKCYVNNGNEHFEITLDKHGQYISNKSAKCVIFPKGKTTWEGFQRPFKDGDIIYTETKGNHKWLSIHKEIKGNCVRNYVDVSLGNNLSFYYFKTFGNILCLKEEISEQRFATKEEKQKLFQAIKDNGYKWNPETKDLEELVNKNKFSIGDTITNGKIVGKIRSRDVDSYQLEDGTYVFFNEVHDWELAPNKFNINTLVSFESKVLVRDNQAYKWRPAIWGFYNEDMGLYPYEVVGVSSFSRCIPYEGNEHLLGTTNDCDDYYKTWE